MLMCRTTNVLHLHIHTCMKETIYAIINISANEVQWEKKIKIVSSLCLSTDLVLQYTSLCDPQGRGETLT